VDDIMVLSKDEGVHVEARNKMIKEFKDITTSTFCGDKVKYLGMDVTFEDSQDGRIAKIDMMSYVKGVIRDFRDDPRKVYESKKKERMQSDQFPANDKIFVHSEEGPLPQNQREWIRSITAKLLYLAKKGRPDILLPVSVLAGRFNKYNTTDAQKLKKIIYYLEGSMSKVLRLLCDDPKEPMLRVYVDASYGVHEGMKGHTGLGFSLGKGLFGCKSTKQTAVADSSTGAELFAVHQSVKKISWMIKFMKEMNINIKQSVIYQDNMACINILSSSMVSTKMLTRHLDIKRCFIKEQIDEGMMRLEHLASELMLVDLLSKGLLGNLYTHGRDGMLNDYGADVSQRK